VHKNIISFLLGSSFAYLFVWLIGVVAAMPVPEFLQAYNEFVVSYYSNILIVIFTAVLSLIIMFVVRKSNYMDSHLKRAGNQFSVVHAGAPPLNHM
jgi:hypothetical protein